MLIQVKPIEAKKWHGKSGSESFTRPKIIQALVDPYSMAYQTGLTEEEEKKYGELLKVDLSRQYSTDTPHPFWDSKMGEIKLENRTQFFNTENPIDFVKIKVMKASKYVANSTKEFENGDFPEATHIIFDESEEVDVKAAHVEIKKKAIIETAKLSKTKKIELVMILSADKDYLKMKNLKGKSDNFLEVELDKLTEKRPDEILRFLKMEKEYVSLYALVLEALQKNVLIKEGHKIMYHESVIAQDIEGAIDYLSIPENQELKLRILAMVNE
jgi:hypothetical protein